MVKDMRIVELTEKTKRDILDHLLKRSPDHYSEYETVVDEIIEQVCRKKDKALFEYTLGFDKFALNAENIRVTKEEIQEA